MALKCLVGLHRWDRCIFRDCGKTRDTEHRWFRCKCLDCGKDEPAGHRLEGCKCSKCDRVRDEQHESSHSNCEICSRCRKIGIRKHDWNGCGCSRCPETRRSDQHTWQGCICSRCRYKRDEQHTWSGCKCSVCEKTRDAEHTWAGCKCSVCRHTRDEQHDWSKNCEQCSACYRKGPGHTWVFTGLNCEKCSIQRTREAAAIELVDHLDQVSGEPNSLAKVIATLGEGQDAAISLVIEALGHIGNSVPERAVDVLVKIGPAAKDALVKAISVKAPYSGFKHRKLAVEALGRIGGSGAVQGLIYALNNDSSEWPTILSTLGKLGDVRAVKPLCSLLNDAKKAGCAANALRLLGDRTAIEPLVAALNAVGGVSDETRYEIGKTLLDFEDPRGLEPLLCALRQKWASESDVSLLLKFGGPTV